MYRRLDGLNSVNLSDSTTAGETKPPAVSYEQILRGKVLCVEAGGVQGASERGK